MSSSGPFGTTVEAKRLVENLLSDLRTLSTESRKKHLQVKEAAESGLVKVKNISAASNEQNLLTNIRHASAELLQPLILGCSSRNARLVQISLQAIQKMVQHRVIESSSAHVIVNELWHLMEAECEELRILQTLTPLVSTELLVTGPWLAKCLVMCFRLNFAKDSIVINTASATVRQMVSCVYERVIQEDGLKGCEMPIVHQTVRVIAKAPPPTLRPCASDGYMLFHDLCLLINAETPCWLIGIQEMTRTLGLELLESVLSSYPSVFIKHPEFAQLLKDQVCPLIIKLFAPNSKQTQIISQHPYSSNARASLDSTSSQMPCSPERVYFPISVRLLRVVVVLITLYYNVLVTECEIFLSLLVKLLESDKLGWQRAIALEVLHKTVVLPDLLIWFCEKYDGKPGGTKVLQSIVLGLASYVQVSFSRPKTSESLIKDDDQHFETNCQATAQTGFLHRGVWIPFCQNIMLKKSLLLDSLDKHEAMNLSDGYPLSLTYQCIIGYCQSLYEAVESLLSVKGKESRKDVACELYQSTYTNLLVAISLFLDASNDESLTEQLLKSFATLATLSCRLGHVIGRDSTYFALCKAALPSKYLMRVLSGIGGLNLIPEPLISSSSQLDKESSTGSRMEKLESESTAGQPNQIVAVGTTCPTPSLPVTAYNSTVMLTAKNMQAARMLLSSAQANGQELGDCWHLVLASVQHLVWILGITPSLQGGFRSEGETTDGTSLVAGSHNSNSVLTTFAMADIPVMATLLNNLFDSTAKLDDVALHHVIAALCKLSSEAMTISQNGSREPSFFAVAMLQQTGMANLSRLEVFWKPVTAHLIEVSSHPYMKLREWGAQAIAVLVKSALKIKCGNAEAKRQQLILTPLSLMSEIEYMDVLRKQIECLVNILQSAGQQLTSEQWPTVIGIIRAIVEGKLSQDQVLVKQTYEAVALMITDFLEMLPFECIQQLVETDAKYGSQQCELNISLSALGQLWTISDFVYRKSLEFDRKESETIWLVLYTCLSELCVDMRPPVRKSACQTLLQTIFAHGMALKAATWQHMFWKVLFPMLDKVRSLTRSASTTRTDSSALGASNILIHHSRDTESKQWAETSVQTLSGVVKIFNSQRPLMLTLEDFPLILSTLLQYIECFAASGNSEMTLAAFKSFQELLLGKVPPLTYEMNRRERLLKYCSTDITVGEEPLPVPEHLWSTSWQSWINMSRTLVLIKPIELNPSSSDLVSEVDLASASIKKNGKGFIPGPAHFNTLLQLFIPLFEKVRKKISCDDFKFDVIPSILKGIVSIPPTIEQASFAMSNTNEITSTQEAVLNCIRFIYQEMLETGSSLRPALPDLIRLMLNFTTFAIDTPFSEYLSNRAENKEMQNMVPFAELSLRTVVEFYASTAHFQEIIHSAVLVDIVKCLAKPMELKYQCPAQSTWKAAASAFVTVLRLGLPVARQHPRCFHTIWSVIAETLERFLFNKSRPSCPLSADERKRHEFIDCQLIELIRIELLPYANVLPASFIQKIIDILNRGSINTVDPSDVLALDMYAQRTELSKICFEALLSLSQNEEQPDIVRSAAAIQFIGELPTDNTVGAGNADKQKLTKATGLGTSAISSLLTRCKQVMLSFVRDDLNAGHLRLSQERIVEMTSVLHAISTLIEGLVRHPDSFNVEFYVELVNLYPTLVDCVTSTKADPQVEQALITALKSYQTLLFLKICKVS